METADSIAVFAVMVAALALAFSTMQWLQSQRERQLGLLLGEKETASYQALRIARRPNARISEDVIRALVLVTLFESSDRARMQVYRALDSLPERHRREVVALRNELRESAHQYGDALDVGSFEKRLAQLETALPWIAENSSGRPPPESLRRQGYAVPTSSGDVLLAEYTHVAESQRALVEVGSSCWLSSLPSPV